ncbi:hypothetical protein DT076_16785 [Desertihabitans brevis]|uniref:Molecular chaperone DnaJ n=1 Tax=Desertihabitans brevis TaxID=2268447 RepID=A0A367YTE6_9ACTN|nr:hypothetical protein [Desertihabitans brevis]RCK68302.1 hypothetical protein DT076_16785 [Desertihabitans brevis]
MTLTLRPLQDWTGGKHSIERSRFDSPWSKTVRLLEREVELMQGRGLVVQIDLREADFRLDGNVRAKATVATPRVRVLFDTPDGTIVFQAGRYTRWRDNVRAVGLSLEALRGVERWGAIQGGAQYKGLLQLEAGGGMSTDDAVALLRQWAPYSEVPANASYESLWRRARANAHPDRSHDPDAFHAVIEAGRVLGIGGAR